MYCDLVRSAGGWDNASFRPGANWSAETGWPTGDFSFMVAVVPDTESFDGNYSLRGSCSAACPALKVEPTASSVRVLNLAMSGDRDFTATLEFPDAAGGQIAIVLTGASGGVSALSILQPGCGAGDTFTPAFVAHVARCDTLRFMDFSAANDHPGRTWANRTAPAWPNWVGSVKRPDGTPDQGGPWEAAIALANAVNRDVWVNVPLFADDEYVTSLATLLSSTLDKDLNIYVEYSNELWNWGFQQSHDLVTMANASVHENGDPFALDYDRGAKCSNGNPPYCWQPRLAIYTAAVRLPKLFAAVFGADAVGPGLRVRPLFASQIAWDDNLLQALTYLEDVVGPPGRLLHAVAGAPYFGTDIAADKMPAQPTADFVLDAVAAALAQYDPRGTNFSDFYMISVFATIAGWHGVAHLGYEGGPDFSAYNSAAVLNATAAAQRDARFAGLYAQYLALWQLHGSNGFLNHFTAGASDWAEQYGNWGLTESMRAPSSTKLAGFDAARAAPMPANALGLALPVARHQAASFAGTYHESPYPPYGALTGQKLNSSWLYPLATSPGDLADGKQLRVVVYTALAAAPTGQQVEACVQGAGALRCAALDIAEGGDVAGGGLASAPALLPLASADTWARGLLVLRLRAAGAGDTASVALCGFDASVV